jgi:diguanylate cyclase (GGDEF)-like protein
MSLIEPVSSLSIKRAVNLYTVVLFLSFGILLYWLATDRYQTFISSHEDKAHNTTKVVAFEINKTLREKQRIIDIFIDSSIDLITELSEDPEDDDVRHVLTERLRKYQPDFFAFNIMNQEGKPVIGDFDGDIGELCLQDLRDYIETGEQYIRLHPNNNAYHYDIVSTYSFNGVRQIFFVSFFTDDISDMLGSVQSENHSLILINKEANNLIEMTADGSRKTISGRLDFRMNGEESFRVLSTAKVKGTSWHVVDMRSEGLFKDYRNKIITEYVIAFYVFSIVVLFMRHILLNQDEKRTTAETQLQKNNRKIIELNNQLELLSKTDSLTGLYNRRYFDEMINLEWNRGLRSNSTMSCILFDIDYFKDYNDYYGHQQGDSCLKDISALMKDSFRRAGDIVARYGGEEFIVVMADSDKQDTVAAIEHFQTELGKLKIPHERSGVAKQVTTSIGFFTQVPSRDESVEDIIRKADEALYRAKSEGRAQWVMFGQ